MRYISGAWPLVTAAIPAIVSTGATVAPALDSGTGRATVLQQITATNTADLDFGAILNIGANQADGAYSGVFTVDFSYP